MNEPTKPPQSNPPAAKPPEKPKLSKVYTMDQADMWFVANKDKEVEVQNHKGEVKVCKNFAQAKEHLKYP